jgi:CRISPR/Cas system-associated exonuclease Cas4 (RecB family)
VNVTAVSHGNGVAGGDLVPYPVQDTRLLLSHLSGSSIKDYLGCSLRYYYRKVEGREEPVSVNLVLGRAVHAGLQRLYLGRWRGEPVSEEEIIAAVDDTYTGDLVDTVVDSDDVSSKRDLGIKMIRAYLASDHCVNAPVPVAVEVALRGRFRDLPTEMVGQVDLVLPGDDGALIPVDFKTIANQPNTEIEGFLHETQTVLYQLLVEDATGARVGGREIVFITKHKEPRVIVHRVPRAGPAAVKRFEAMAKAAYNGILNRNWVPQPGMACAWCGFRDLCSVWGGEEVKV